MPQWAASTICVSGWGGGGGGGRGKGDCEHAREPGESSAGAWHTCLPLYQPQPRAQHHDLAPTPPTQPRAGLEQPRPPGSPPTRVRRSTHTSGTVLMPTASPPSRRSIWISWGVSYEGPGTRGTTRGKHCSQQPPSRQAATKTGATTHTRVRLQHWLRRSRTPMKAHHQCTPQPRLHNRTEQLTAHATVGASTHAGLQAQLCSGLLSQLTQNGVVPDKRPRHAHTWFICMHACMHTAIVHIHSHTCTG